jgi:hypothetical protein
VTRWYAAHLIMYVQFKKHVQRTYPVRENVVLIRADSAEEAFEKAERRGKEDEGDSSGTFTWGGKPATWVFGGVRKLMKCGADEKERPNDGTEVTYLKCTSSRAAPYSS